MKAEIYLAQQRTLLQSFWKAYQAYLESDGSRGMGCTVPEDLEASLNATDEELLTRAEERGVYIADKEEYLANKKSE